MRSYICDTLFKDFQVQFFANGFVKEFSCRNSHCIDVNIIGWSFVESSASLICGGIVMHLTLFLKDTRYSNVKNF